MLLDFLYCIEIMEKLYWLSSFCETFEKKNTKLLTTPHNEAR